MTQLKFGRLPPKQTPSIKFADIRTAAVPDHPATEDYLAAFKNWQMLGNDTYGDCVAVTWANMRRMFTGALSVEYYPTLNQVYQLYRTQNPNFVPLLKTGHEYHWKLKPFGCMNRHQGDVIIRILRLFIV